MTDLSAVRSGNVRVSEDPQAVLAKSGYGKYEYVLSAAEEEGRLHDRSSKTITLTMATHQEPIKAEDTKDLKGETYRVEHSLGDDHEAGLKARHHDGAKLAHAAESVDAAGGQFDVSPEDRKRVLRMVDLGLHAHVYRIHDPIP